MINNNIIINMCGALGDEISMGRNLVIDLLLKKIVSTDNIYIYIQEKTDDFYMKIYVIIF
jgi:hypothetical protein